MLGKRLTLTQKGLVFIALPFLVQIVFFVVYGLMLEQSESVSKLNIRKKNVLGRANWVSTLLLASVATCAGYEYTGDERYKKQFESFIAKTRTSAQALAPYLSDNPEQTKLFEANLHAIDNYLNDLKDSANSPRVNQHLKSHRLFSYDAVEKRFSELQDLRRRLIGSESERLELIPVSALPSTHSALRNWLTAGIVFDVMVGMFLMLRFSTSIARRIEILRDKSNQLARSEPLKPRLAGDDEIADLDRAFHDAAEALTFARQKERAVIENMIVGAVVINESNVIELVNPRIKSIFGYDAAELVGEPVQKLFPVQTQLNGIDVDNSILNSSLNQVTSFDTVTGSGQPISVEISTSNFESVEGKRFLINVLDISERRAIERFKSEFVSMVSHDLRTPLSSVQGTLALVSEGAYGEISEKGVTRVKAAENNLERLIKLINELLDIDKIESGMFQLDQETSSILELARTAAQAVESVAERKNINLSLPSEDLSVFVDRERIVQVFINLLSNAIKFSPDHCQIEISFERVGTLCRVTVSDQGRGIAPEFVGAIFDRFKQVEKSDARRGRGSGLGLAISKALIESHGGEIGVESEVGSGSSFWFTCPLA